MAIQLPFATSHNQRFRTKIQGELYRFTLKTNSYNYLSYISISDRDGKLLASSIPLVTGIDLINGYQLGIGQIRCFNTKDINTNINVSELGSTSFVVSMTDEEYRNA